MKAATTSHVPPLALAAAAGLHVLVGIAVLDLRRHSLAFDETRPVEIEIVIPATPPQPAPTAEPVVAAAESETATFDPAFIPEPEPPPPLVFEPPKPPPPKPASRPVTRPAPAVPTAPATPIAAAPAAPRHDPIYLDRLAAAIERERDYPLHSRRQGHQGRVVIHLVIAASGKLIAAQVATGSGLETLDRAALGMVQRARLPPLGPGLGAESATFTIPIVFAIR